jgi:7-keto-8-aminopelargonate synthetase-like enzyme
LRAALLAVIRQLVDLDTLLADELGQMRARGLFRDPEDVAARERVAEAARSQALTLIDATCNDYLGLGRQQVRLVEDFEGAAPPMGLPPSEDQRSDVSRETFRAGSGAARLVQGTWPIHLALEAALADWVGLPAALLFNSGYAANSGAIPALAGSDSVVFSDRLNHASIVDGCRLSKSRVEVLPHLDLDALEAALKGASACATRWVVTESYFSMDGDGPDLLSLRRLCDRHAA